MAIYGHLDPEEPPFGQSLSESLSIPTQLVYTALASLEAAGLVCGQQEDRTGLPRRPRRLYRITAAGIVVVQRYLALANPAAGAAPARQLAGVLARIVLNDTNYDVRYALVIEAMHLALRAGYAAGIGVDPKEEPEFAAVVYIELPEGQLSWHMPIHPHSWDNHTTSEKFERIMRFCARMSEPEPALTASS